MAPSGAQEFLTSQHLVGVVFVKLSSSEVLKHDEETCDDGRHALLRAS